MRIDSFLAELGLQGPGQSEIGAQIGAHGEQEKEEEGSAARKMQQRAETIARRKRGVAITDSLALRAGALPVYRM